MTRDELKALRYRLVDIADDIYDRCRKRPSMLPMTSPCLIWDGYADATGHGTIVRDKKRYKVHEVTYQARKGVLLHQEDVRHKCGNRLCVRPEHMYAVPRSA